MPRTVTRRTPDQRRAEIIEAAHQSLRALGLERFVTADAASRAGVSEALVYRYFPTKRALLTSVAEAWFAQMLAAPPDPTACTGTYERLRYLVAYSLGVVRDEPAITRFILTDLRSEPSYRSSALYDLNRRFTGIVTDVLRQAVAAGDLRDDVGVPLLRDMIFGAIEHQTWKFLRDEGDFELEDTAGGITRVIYRGMAAGASPAGGSTAAGRSRDRGTVPLPDPGEGAEPCHVETFA